MTRRDFIKTTAAGSLALALPTPKTAGGAEQKKPGKPNLLFIWTDEQRADTMAVYGNTKIRVPNLNKLASESFVFKKAYVTQPVCTPSRCSVMTGLWPHTSGLIRNNLPLPPETRCLPELLNDSEYRTAYMGKWHLGDEIFPQHGFEEWVSIEDIYWKRYTKVRDKEHARTDYYYHLVSLGYKTEGQAFGRTFAAGLPFEQSKPKFLERRACDFLRRHRGEPFILYVNFLEPHMPFTGPFDKEYDPAYVNLPASFDDPLEDNEPLVYRKKREQIIKEYGSDEQSFRKLIARYWGLVTEVDICVGGILNTLEELGLADNTIVVYTSDHGDMMGAHRLVTKGVMYEEAARVPWLMRIPWMGRRQHVIEQPVSHIDLVPTLLELMSNKAGKAGRGLQGQSLVPLIKGRKPAEDHVFIEWNVGTEQELSAPVRTVVSPDGWKLSLFKGDNSQLFNLNEDPGETRNLFDSGRHKDVINRLTEKIRRWQKKTADTLPTSFDTNA
ncbi:MAG TPA: sulfatase-like hydrolase/transferase [Sedimentisphaerales bacterium]|nr:sulfatase-like hydrolase/transferase [Sedimentisphaerales bacterium]